MKRKVLIILLTLSMLVSLTSCNGSGTDPAISGNVEPPNQDSASESASAVKNKDALVAELNQYRDQSEYSVEGATPMDVRKEMDGKSVYVIPASVSTPFNSETCGNMLEICKQLGIKSDWYTTNGTIDSWIAAIETAVNQGYDIIGGFSGVIPEVLTSQIEYAESKNVPVVDLHFHDFADADSCDASYCLPADYELAGRILALWAINSCEGEGDVAIVTSRELDASLAMERGIESAFGEYAPDMGRTYLHVVVTDWATKIQTEVQNALLANPDIKYVICIYDVMTTYTVAAIEAVGKTGEVKICAYNGSTFALDLVNEGLVEMDLGESLECMAYCLLDQMFRIATGREQLPAENPPFYIWTKDNVSQALDPETGKAGYGGYDRSYVEYYKDLWMLDEVINLD